ncbi:heat-inducible transcription repressor [Rhynchospora pubera]|uniref:Heat-inducible transcription repressor n=1 Tax=Rhynchospora pubera TaxID=906938 RepID=A0AAV8GGQ8_9POAL|nr:heat-inducible transcription repressor [Rhynchospora pubera]
MAYRRKQVSTTGPSTFESPFSLASPPSASTTTTAAPALEEEGEAPSLAAQAIRASAAHRDSSLSSAYGDPVFHHDSSRASVSSSRRPRESNTYEYTSMRNLNESKSGFWGNLARKAKAFLDEDNLPKQFNPMDSHTESTSTSNNKFNNSYQPPKNETPPVQKKSTEAIASSLNYIGGTLKNAFEEGKTIVGSTTADIIQETRKLNIRRKGSTSNSNQQNENAEKWSQPYLPRTQTDYETQLKASRDVANAMAAKAKLLLRELKTVKADLAFAKERCAQLEDENKVLRESHDKGGGPEDDDLIRLQLETLLAEKSRLAHENSVYARENRFLREIVEYHQLTMQDVIYVDEGIEEVTEVYPTQVLPPVASTASKKGQKGQPSPLVVPDACPVVPTSPHQF